MKKYIKIKENKLWALGFIGLGILSILPEKDITLLVWTLLIGLPVYFSKA